MALLRDSTRSIARRRIVIISVLREARVLVVRRVRRRDRGDHRIATEDGSAYFAKGYDGQYVFVVPSARMVFVRFGKGYGDVDWVALFMRLAH